jgi:hypothetical protein
MFFLANPYCPPFRPQQFLLLGWGAERTLYVIAPEFNRSIYAFPRSSDYILIPFGIPGARVRCIACAAHQLVVAPSAY